jgi:hypothetical protein
MMASSVQMIKGILFRSTDCLTRMTSVLSFFFIARPRDAGDDAPGGVGAIRT